MAITAERTAITRLAGVAVLRKRSVEACGLYAVDAVHGQRVNAGDMCLRTILPYSGNAMFPLQRSMPCAHYHIIDSRDLSLLRPMWGSLPLRIG
jgi:hypothetical protein